MHSKGCLLSNNNNIGNENNIFYVDVYDYDFLNVVSIKRQFK